jgi:proteasome-associated ATPase
MPATSDFLTLIANAPRKTRPDVLAHLLRLEPDLAGPLAQEFLKRNVQIEETLQQSNSAIEELKKLIDEITRPPLNVAVVVAVSDGRCVVALGHARHEVAIHPSLRGVKLEVGDTVALAQDGHIVVERLSHFRPPGRVTTVRGWHNDRLRVDCGADQTLVVDASPGVVAEEPREGDKVLIYEEGKVAIELVERANEPRCDQVDPLSFDQIGGLESVIEDLLVAVEARFLYPERAAEVGLEPLGGMILVGPPGIGKTMLVRALVDHMKRNHGRRVGFENVAPGSWRNPFFGVSDEKIIEPLVRAEQRLAAGEVDMMILYYDELDTFGSRTGEITSRIDSRLLNALLHKIDSITGRPERRLILLVGATNRIDLLDEALIRPGRFGDQIIQIPRPNRAGARAIFRCHLSPKVRFWTNGEAAPPEEMVERCADAALTPLFRDADPLDALAELVLAGGERRLVWPREVVSGAMIAGIVQRAKRLALRRGLVGPAGLVPGDFARASEEELDTIASRFSDPYKVREILGERDLPVARSVPRVRRGSPGRRTV